MLGVDGMDPSFVERHWDALPNLAKLRSEGHFSRLQTIAPPQSPVAWSSFITGLDPGEHGIFDFVHRDPATLKPFSSMSRTEEPRWRLPLGPFIFPLSSSHVVSLRRGKPFWQSLFERGIPVTVIRMPTNYPPVEAGHALSGMGTPDLRGTLGTFTYYTNDPIELSHSVAGGRFVKVALNGGHVVLPVEGPPNPLRKDQRYATADLIVDVDPEHPVARLKFGEDVAVIQQGEWSGWMSADFPLIPHLSSVRGMFRVFAKQLKPDFQLYVSAVNVDPIAPALPIAAPSKWGRTVAEETGRFFTLGTPEDTSALRQGVLTLPEFQAQSRLVLEDERQLLRFSLRHFTGGLLFFYFSSIDQNSHMLWGRYEPQLLDVYSAVDASIGEVRRAAPQTELIVMSDHGFTTFDRAVNLNAWLRQRGFLSLTSQAGEDPTFGTIDWSSTEAYALGLNGLYLNLKGREQHGIVAAGRQRAALLASLGQQLKSWHDPANGHPVVETVYQTHASPANAAVAPDLIVGYSPGYRASWQTGVGNIPMEELEDNHDAWIGDHCINPADVPGVLFTSDRQMRTSGIQNVTGLILRFFD